MAAGIRLEVLGGLGVMRDGEPVGLPRSKKTRALLAYLALNRRPHRRDRLCELFWDVPEDPRAALRWSLSKLRAVVNDPSAECLKADRERVLLDGIEVDIEQLTGRLEAGRGDRAALADVARRLNQPLLSGQDLPDLAEYQAWLTAEREHANQIRAAALERLVEHPDTPPPEALDLAREWLRILPYSTDAATSVHDQLRRLGRDAEAVNLAVELHKRFDRAGVRWQPGGARPGTRRAQDVRAQERALLAEQRIRFCTAADGATIAYATVGAGPPLVKAANWLSHLEHDWNAPIWSPLFRQLARDFTFVRYDERGNGLSDWDVDDISFEKFVTDLETVVDRLELERFPLLGISQGASVSIEYAVRHPERVSHLILFGGYAAGWRHTAGTELYREREAVMTLTAAGWGQDNPAYRQIFSSTFMPDASIEELAWFNEFQRLTTSPDNAVRFLQAFGEIDVRDRLGNIATPTLVLHSSGDQRIPADTGRELASSIPDAEFVTLDSNGHLLLGREPASAAFVDAVVTFIARH